MQAPTQHGAASKAFLRIAGKFRADLPDSLFIDTVTRGQAAGGGKARLSMQVADQAFIANATHVFEDVLRLLNLPLDL